MCDEGGLQSPLSIESPNPNPNPRCNRQTRSYFGTNGCFVRGYPSFGGVVISSFSAVELEWLGLSRLEPASRSADQGEEDAFCYQMLRLGARWWKNDRFHDHKESEVSGGYPFPDHFPPDLYVGYPSGGGIWVLMQKNGESLPDDFGRVGMAFTMDERCAMMKEMGATFYEKVQDCPDIAKDLKDGRRIGQWWEEKMKEMEYYDPP